MLQSMGSQRVVHDLATEQQEEKQQSYLSKKKKITKGIKHHPR